MTDTIQAPRTPWSAIIEWEQERLCAQLRRGDRITLVSRHDGTRVPAVLTSPPDGTRLQAALAGSPVGTPIHLSHWAIEIPVVCDRHEADDG